MAECKNCGGENFRTVRVNHIPTGYKCVKCGEITPLKKAAVKKGLEKIYKSEDLENGI